MTASLFLYQTPYQRSAADSERGRFGCSGPNSSTVPKPYDRSSYANSDRFLKTLEKISYANNPNQPSRTVDKEKYFCQIPNTPNEKVDEDTSITFGTHNFDMRLSTKRQVKNQNIEKHPPSIGSVLTEIKTHLEKLGVSGLEGESGISIHSNEIQGSIEGLTELKLHIDQLLEIHYGINSDLKTHFAQLYHWMENSQVYTELKSRIESYLSGFSNSGLNELGSLNQFVDKIFLGKEFENLTITEQPMANGPSKNSTETYRSLESILAAVSRLKDKVAISESAGILSPTNPNERISLTISSGSQSNSESTLLNLPNTQPHSAEKTADDSSKELASGHEKRSANYTVRDTNLNFESSSLSKMADDARLAEGSNRKGLTAAERVRMEALEIESLHGKRFIKDPQTTRATESVQRFGSESSPNSGGNSDTSLVSKMIHDAQIAKENQMRIVDSMIDETAGKVTRVNAGSSDSGLPGSQHQLTEKNFELTSLSRQANLDQDGLKTRTLDQIVRKAVVYMRNGQHEAKIELRPEFLGHVRMQVTTESHQVTVRILTEFGFVKEMVENNIHQLKGELQQQGLQVDKLEVAVSNDPDENKNSQEKSGQAKTRQHGGAHTNLGNEEKEDSERRQAGNAERLNSDELTVDYFV